MSSCSSMPINQDRIVPQMHQMHPLAQALQMLLTTLMA